MWIIPKNWNKDGYKIEADSGKPRILSLCTGYGGIELGISRVLRPLFPIACVEIEAFAIANLVSKMETGKLAPSPIWTDVKTLPTEPFRDCVDILTGGYPCQPFSHAGKRKGTDDPRHLWPGFLRIIENVRPKMCFFENVEGHISLGLREVLSDLESQGYGATWGIFSAEEVGAPHQRKRVYILARRRGKVVHSTGLRLDKGSLPSRDEAEDSPYRVTSQAVWRTFPMPPGSKQFCWEEPRTVANSNSRVGPGPAQSKLGRAVNGTVHRVDRLRLLGNGVVPQTAEKAFFELYRNKNIKGDNIC